MRMSKLLGRQIKEVPRDATTASHIFLLRGGYIRPVSAGIYSLLPLAKRMIARIERILREEMDRVEGQEVMMPVVLPRELWEQSGRYQSVGAELLRFKDRNDKDMLLGMTHEEAVVHIARTELTSYKQLPVMLYQIQTKYRDEARPRAGLIRVREFTMKDAYSFHASQSSLVETYDAVHEAYVRIFKRIGMRDVVSIESDTGMIGGSKAHEFMALSEIGEDTILASPDRSYLANREVAVSGVRYTPGPLPAALEEVATPEQKTIEEVAAFLGVQSSGIAKAVLLTTPDDRLVFALVRGDLDVNEAKLSRAVRSPSFVPASDAQIRAAGLVPGFIGPVGFDPAKLTLVVDPSVVGTHDLVIGANREGFHLKHFAFERDLSHGREAIVVADIVNVRAGDPCPLTGAPLEELRGIEVGNIFQLGTKYSASMGAVYLDEDGKAQPFIMGCYGIGVGRALASTLEQCHDDFGPIWPISIAPFEVELIALNARKGGVDVVADEIYQELRRAGLDVLLDDRDHKAGSLFADADLLGVPFRVIVSARGLENGEIEVKSRDGSLHTHVARAELVDFLKAQVAQAYAALEP